jgi:hypothetical protein
LFNEYPLILFIATIELFITSRMVGNLLSRLTPSHVYSGAPSHDLH